MILKGALAASQRRDRVFVRSYTPIPNDGIPVSTGYIINAPPIIKSGDLLVAAIMHRRETPIPPSGWNLYGQTQGYPTGNDPFLPQFNSIFIKQASASEPSSYSFNYPTASQRIGGTILCVANAQIDSFASSSGARNTADIIPYKIPKNGISIYVGSSLYLTEVDNQYFFNNLNGEIINTFTSGNRHGVAFGYGANKINHSNSNITSGSFVASRQIIASKNNKYIYEDTYFNNVSLLLHMDDVSSGVYYFDSSKNNFLGTGSVSGFLSNRQSISGPSSFLSSGCFIEFEDKDDFVLSGIDFTLEAWIRPTVITPAPHVPYIVSRYATEAPIERSWALGLDLMRPRLIYSLDSVNFKIISSSTSLEPNTWYHLAATRSSNTLRLFVNGILAATGFETGSFYNSFDSDTTSKNYTPLTIGKMSRSSLGLVPFSGYIDEVRITKGFCRYTGNFSPEPRYLP